MQSSEFKGPQWLKGRKLPDLVSLQVLDENQQVLFSSKGKWLHPLFEAQSFIVEKSLVASSLVLHDRIAGRAAAALAVHIGFCAVRASLMSRLAESVYVRYGVPYWADGIVDRIDCRTEELINDSMHLEEIYSLMLERANRSRAQ